MNQVCKICRKNELRVVKEMKGKELKSIRNICFSCGARARGISRYARESSFKSAYRFFTQGPIQCVCGNPMVSEYYCHHKTQFVSWMDENFLQAKKMLAEKGIV